jgi:hypothetical protein
VEGDECDSERTPDPARRGMLGRELLAARSVQAKATALNSEGKLEKYAEIIPRARSNDGYGDDGAT